MCLLFIIKIFLTTLFIAIETGVKVLLILNFFSYKKK